MGSLHISSCHWPIYVWQLFRQKWKTPRSHRNGNSQWEDRLLRTWCAFTIFWTSRHIISMPIHIVIIPGSWYARLFVILVQLYNFVDFCPKPYFCRFFSGQLSFVQVGVRVRNMPRYPKTNYGHLGTTRQPHTVLGFQHCILYVSLLPWTPTYNSRRLPSWGATTNVIEQGISRKDWTREGRQFFVVVVIFAFRTSLSYLSSSALKLGHRYELPGRRIMITCLVIPDPTHSK